MPQMSYVRAFNRALHEEMQRDERVFVMGEDVGGFGGVWGLQAGLLKKFGPKRVRQTPISEAAFTGCAVGAAMTGLRPVVEIMYNDFVTVCMDQVTNQAAKLRYVSGGQLTLPLVIHTPGGAGTCEAAQHSQCLEAWFAHCPGLKVVLPSTPYDAKGLMKTAVRDDNPVYLMEHRLLLGTPVSTVSDTPPRTLPSLQRCVNKRRAACVSPSLARARRASQTAQSSSRRSTPFAAAPSSAIVKRSGRRGRPGPPGFPFRKRPAPSLPLLPV